MESSNGANSVILYDKGGDISTNRREELEMTVLCLRILQAALVYINTLMRQDVLADPEWAKLLKPTDLFGIGGRAGHLVGDGEQQVAMDDERLGGAVRLAPALTHCRPSTLISTVPAHKTPIPPVCDNRRRWLTSRLGTVTGIGSAPSHGRKYNDVRREHDLSIDHWSEQRPGLRDGA
ncbi:Tn3 family transposase [Nonomuraea sp. 3N208]|uniref:Tn3 family transposase n=1 Tax=Nonomuraea sp. 3N208 TaxID=3457421 RepID=UPI003FD67218